jgi:rare lipoprotein A
VKVEYVGRAPLKGSDDGKLAATLRNNVADTESGVQVASAQPFNPTAFDVRSRSIVVPRRAPVPPDRPYGADEGTAAQQLDMGARAAPAVFSRQSRAAPTIELAAAKRPQAAPSRSEPVSAYAPLRYDGSVGFVSGRGLY